METQDTDVDVSVEDKPQDKPSMDDTIRQAYASIKDQIVDEPQDDEPQDDRPRDEHGRFAPKAKELDAQPEAPPETQSEAQPEVQERIPSSLSGTVKAKWASLDPDVRKEFAKREDDFHRGFQQLKPAADFGQQMYKVLEPHMQRIQSMNVHPGAAIDALLRADNNLRTAPMAQKRQMLQKIIEDYGITFDDNDPAPQPQFDPNQILSQVPQLVSQTLRQQQEAYESERAVAEVDAFAQANDKFGLMNDWQQAPDGSMHSPFRQMMHSAIQSGLANDLGTAYEIAARAHPQSYEQLVAQQQAKQEEERKSAEEKRRQEQAQRIASARKASSVNVRSRGTVPQAPAKGTMEDTLRATLRQITGS